MVLDRNDGVTWAITVAVSIRVRAATWRASSTMRSGAGGFVAGAPPEAD